jgi:hypothetical protein
MVIYVGRVDNRSDRVLKDRMVEHFKEYKVIVLNGIVHQIFYCI